MKNILSFAILLAFFPFFSCSKDDNNNIVEKKILLSKSTLKSGRYITIISFSYDTQDRLSSYFYGTYTNTKLVYNAAGQMDESFDIHNTEIVASVKFKYDQAGKCTKKEYFDGSNEPFITYDISYQPNMYTETITDVTADTVVAKTEYYYTSDKKNIQSSKQYTRKGKLNNTVVYEYDNKKGIEPLTPLSGIGSVFANANNKTSFTVTPASGAAYTTTFRNEYNADGYLTKWTDSNGDYKEFEYLIK